MLFNATFGYHKGIEVGEGGGAVSSSAVILPIDWLISNSCGYFRIEKYKRSVLIKETILDCVITHETGTRVENTDLIYMFNGAVSGV